MLREAQIQVVQSLRLPLYYVLSYIPDSATFRQIAVDANICFKEFLILDFRAFFLGSSSQLLDAGFYRQLNGLSTVSSIWV